MKRYSTHYVEHIKRGPFPGRVDPWAEAGRYFQQLHAEMISTLMLQTQDTLIEMGYSIGREASLQITERREPDIYIEQEINNVQPPVSWNYPQAAASVLAEPGISIEEQLFELEALHIIEVETGDLVTIIEIISPKNKESQGIIRDYIQNRRHFVRDKGVNVVELDLTRSVKRLLDDGVVKAYPYNVAVHLPRQKARLIGIAYGESLKRLALPLRAEVIPVELQSAYDQAYQQASIAMHIERESHYSEIELPFPSLLLDSQRQETLETVQHWLAELNHLRTERSSS
jgi:Protein of unknown function (DUF4058)